MRKGLTVIIKINFPERMKMKVKTSVYQIPANSYNPSNLNLQKQEGVYSRRKLKTFTLGKYGILPWLRVKVISVHSFGARLHGYSRTKVSSFK